jgi:hypothetical protein
MREFERVRESSREREKTKQTWQHRKKHTPGEAHKQHTNTPTERLIVHKIAERRSELKAVDTVGSVEQTKAICHRHL